MRSAVGIDAGLCGERGSIARLALDDGRVAQVRGLLDSVGELCAEFTEGQELRAILDQAECRGIPEAGGAAVAEHDLVAIGQREEIRETCAQTTDL